MISHDRTLLDRVCNQIWELDKGNIRVFDGNYSDWAAQKERERGFQEFEYQQYTSERRRLAQALVEGRRLHISGGDYVLCPRGEECPGRDCARRDCGMGRCGCGACLRSKEN